MLAAVDATVLLAARALLQVLREAAWSSAVTTLLFPEGLMGGWGSVAALLVGLVASGAYASEERWAAFDTVLRGVALGAGLAMWQALDIFGIPWTITHWLLVTGVLGAVIGAERGVLFLAVMRFKLAAEPRDQVILVGDPASRIGQRAASELLNRPGIASVGWLSERGGAKDYLGHPSAVWEVLCDTGTDTVVLCGDHLAPGLFEAVAEAAAVAGCRVLSVRDRETLTASRPRVLNGGTLKMLELTFPAARAGQDGLKRAFDIVVSAILLVVLSPLMLALSLFIKLDSKGPILFVQDRVGQAGRVFTMMKFRTMRDGADSEKPLLAHMNTSGDSRLFKIPDDPRVTRLGAFLRRWSLDELPQLLNIIRGDMSLVGPRPFFESDLAAYDDHHFLRLAVKPGVTGLWQVKGRSSIVDFEEVVKLDRQYIEDWSFGLDLSILLSTIPAVLRRTGAY
ncbi:MAG: exopolysaccharide biosynthesis polyprenyl glycosylphosphotransferase [Gemmatimonadota bacterium]|nr:exopolysaccharide biosynthesis polyprenyl glycosylphosphotransferase [Gemmatimonadota bacterium]